MKFLEKKLQEFLDQFEFTSLEWDGTELTAFTQQDSWQRYEFVNGTPTYNGFYFLEKVLRDLPPFAFPNPTVPIGMLDITAPEHGVQIIIREDRKVLWVNVDGICRLRICDIPYLSVEGE